ncbi:NLRC3, partial [Symbiodinium necroappetens]
ALADALQSNKTVTDINLDGYKIGDEGAKALADALNSNRAKARRCPRGFSSLQFRPPLSCERH